MRNPRLPRSEIARRDAARRRARTQVSQDIGKLPKVKNPKRRKAGLKSFGLFCKTYFPEIFYLSWSKDLLKVIAKIERVVLDHDNLAVAMPRGSGKSSLCLAAILWAVLSGRHRFVILIGATADDATDAIMWAKKQLSGNPLLLADYPEVCYPIKLLDNEPRRCLGQRYKGQKTNIHWGSNRIVLPTIGKRPPSGSIIDATSIEGKIRGAKFSMPGGALIRPTLALCDDPQTSETARSQGPSGQTTYRLQVIKQDVKGLAGPDQQTGILIPCTVICPGDLADQVLDRKRFPTYRGERTKRLYSWPTNKALWEQYRELREAAMQADQPLDESREFYRSRMCQTGRKLDTAGACATCPHKTNCMDCGAVVDWAERLDDPRNLSAVQAAMHAFFEYGASGFAAEFQNEPLTSDSSEARLTAAQVQMRYTKHPRGVVPLDCTELTMFIDVQQCSLWFVVCAWRADFTGHIVDYGVWPSQNRSIFTLREIASSSRNLQTMYPGKGVEGTIQAGLEDLVTRSLAKDFIRAGDNSLMRIGRLLVDMGGPGWDKLVSAVKMKAGGATMMLSKGVGIRAGNKPMSALKRKPGERHGDHWYIPAVKGTREFPHVMMDSNYWKAHVQNALLIAPGDPGALTLFGENPEQHELFAGHIAASEYWTETEGHGRKVHEYSLKPDRPDNHWLDGLYGCAVAASLQGVKIPNQQEPRQAGLVRRKRVSIDELLARRERMEEKA